MEFVTRQELIENLSNNYEQEGVVFTIKTSKEKRVVMKCDWGEEYVNMLSLTDETCQRGDAHEANWLWVWDRLLVDEGCLGSP